MCPIRGIKDKSIRCKMKNEVDKKNTEECILAQYYKGNYTDLTII